MERNKWESGCSKRSTERDELLDKGGWKIMFINLEDCDGMCFVITKLTWK